MMPVHSSDRTARPSPSSRPFRPLSRQVVALALACSALFSVGMTAGLVALDYGEERAAALQQLQFAARSYERSLANSVWDLDMEAAQLQVEALANFPMIGRVSLHTSIGQVLVGGKDQSAQSGPEELTYRSNLFSPERPDHQVGVLQLHANGAALVERIQSNGLRILAAESLKGLLFGMLMAWLVGRRITRHLSDVAQQVAEVQPSSLSAPLRLQRPPRSHDDELDQLCAAFNGMNRQLASYIQVQGLLEEELRRHRNHLTDMVTARTTSLEQLRSFHDVAIQVLTRFINAPQAHLDTALNAGLGAFGEYFNARACLLFAHDANARGFVAAHAWQRGDTTLPLDAVRLPELARLAASSAPQRSGGLDNEGLGNAGPDVESAYFWHTASEQETLFDAAHPLAGQAVTLVGVAGEGERVGVLCLVGQTIAADTEHGTLLALAAQMAVNMLCNRQAQRALLLVQDDLRQANHELERLSRHDDLTGLANRRQFDRIKEMEFRRAQRAQAPLAVLMCDIDEFKRYNDTYGHAQGDACLVQVAQCLQRLFNRSGELVARMGGEEFAVLLPNAKPEQAEAAAARVRQAVLELQLPHRGSRVARCVTISVGAAVLEQSSHPNFDALLAAADRALYEAKARRQFTPAQTEQH